MNRNLRKALAIAATILVPAGILWAAVDRDVGGPPPLSGPQLIANINEEINALGMPVGGTTGQVLSKTSNADYDVQWVTGGGGGADGLGPDGDKGEISVGGGGTTLTIDNEAVTTAKIADATITPADINPGGASDEQCLTFEATGSVFEWQTCAVGGGGDSISVDGSAADDANFINSADLDFTLNTGATPDEITAVLLADAVGNSELRDSAALSVIGNATNATANPADIAAASDGEVLRRSGTTLGFGTIATLGIADDAVTFAKLQDIATDRLIGRDTAASGSPEEIGLDDTLEFTGSLSIQRAALTGDVTATAGSNVTDIAADVITTTELANDAVATANIANDAVSYAKIQNVTTDRLLGRDTASSGDVEELTVGGGVEFTGTGIQRSALTGDVTAAAGSNATAIAANAVALGTDTTNDYVANVADGTGIDGSTTGETQTYTPSLDLTEINSATWGAANGFTSLTFDATGTANPVVTMGDGSVTWSAITAYNLDDEAELRLFEEDANGANFIGFKAPANIGTNRQCVLQDGAAPIPDSCVGDGTDAGGSGLSVGGTQADSAVPVADDGSTTTWRVIPDCAGAADTLNYSQSTNSFSCGSDAGAGGGMTALIDDTSPQLGGFLDWNGFTQRDDLLTDSVVLDLQENALSLTNDAIGTTGVILDFHHDSASPADGDLPLDIRVRAGTDDEEIGRIAYELDDPATTTEDGRFNFHVDVAGTSAQQMVIGGGVIIGTSTTLPGAGALRLTSIELGADTDTTLTRSAAGEMQIEGVDVVEAGDSPTLGTITTTGTIELGNVSDTTLARVSAGVISVEGVTIVTTATDDDIPDAADYTNLTGGTAITNSPTGTINFDATEINTFTLGAGAATGIIFDAGATDPAIETASGSFTVDIGGTNETTLTASAFAPGVDAGSDLGTTALAWNALHGDTGFVWNIENGDWIATHTAGIMTVGTGDLRVTTAGTNSASVVTVGGTQTLTGKSIAATQITAGALNIGNNAATVGTVELANGTANTLSGSAGVLSIEGAALAFQSITLTAGTGLSGGGDLSANRSVALDTTEVSSATWGAGAFTTFTFDAGATDPLLTFGSGTMLAEAITSFRQADAANAGGAVRLLEDPGTGANFIAFAAPAAITTDVTCTLENDGNPIPDSCVGDGTDAGGSGAQISGTPADNQLAVWTNATTIEGDSALTFDTSTDALSIGTGGVFTAGTIELGAASDTTLSRSAAGVLAIEGVNVVTTATNKPTESLCLALSDETTTITTGTAKVTMRMPYAFTLSNVRASVNGDSSSGVVTVDINEAGSTIMSTNKLTIDANEETSVTAATAVGLTDTALGDDAEMTFDVDGAGTGTTGLKVCMIGNRT